MFGDGNGPRYDWRRQPSSIWLKSVVNWTHNIIFSDVHEVIVPLMETVGARAG